MHIEFKDVQIGEVFDPGFTHIIERPLDKFPERYLSLYMKIKDEHGERGLHLRTGITREIMPNHTVRVVTVKIVRV